MARLPVGNKCRALLLGESRAARERWWVGRHGLLTVRRHGRPKRVSSPCTGLWRFMETPGTYATQYVNV